MNPPLSNLNPIFQSVLAPWTAGMRSRKIKSWEEKQADMMVRVELNQDGLEAFEVASYRLGSSIPVLYRFNTFEAADAHYSAFISFHQQSPGVESKLAAELEMLHSLCASAQCWLDAAGHVAPEHLKTALQANADEFRRVYAKITS